LFRDKFVIIGASNIYRMKDLHNVETIAIPGLSLKNGQKLSYLYKELRQFKERHLGQRISILLSDLGNTIFPGRPQNKCYLYKCDPATVQQYCKMFKQYIEKILSILPKARIYIIPCLGRRDAKCNIACNRCISYPDYVYTLYNINEGHKHLYKNNSNIKVISYNYFYKELFGNRPIFQATEIQAVTESFLCCGRCKYTRIDYIHSCCTENLIRHARLYENLVAGLLDY
jgi:hypothetical protein